MRISTPLVPSAILTLVVALPGAAAVTGSAVLEGEAPAEVEIKMNADPKCVDLHTETVNTSFYRVGADGALADVFVYVENPPPGEHPAPETPVVLGQEGCLYEPTVGGILVDQTLEIHNHDDILHNVRALARENRPFNLGQPGKGVRTKTFKLPEPAIRMRCDVHPWMESTIFVLEHPFFAVTGGDGAFRIEGLPAGTYTLVAWHSRLGEQRAEVTVGSDGQATAAFSFQAP